MEVILISEFTSNKRFFFCFYIMRTIRLKLGHDNNNSAYSTRLCEILTSCKTCQPLNKTADTASITQNPLLLNKYLYIIHHIFVPLTTLVFLLHLIHITFFTRIPNYTNLVTNISITVETPSVFSIEASRINQMPNRCAALPITKHLKTLSFVTFI